jgi:hypothetical protein
MMFTDPGNSDSFLFSDLNALRIEAMTLFERSMRDGTPARLVAFVEAQIALDPPPVPLLHEIADDLHRRLQSLRQLQFDLRAHMLHTLRESYGIDLAPLLPVNGFNPHLSVDVILARLLPDGVPDELSLRHTLETTFEASQNVTDDILMVEGMYKFLVDWATALSVNRARGSWMEDSFKSSQSRLH